MAKPKRPVLADLTQNSLPQAPEAPMSRVVVPMVQGAADTTRSTPPERPGIGAHPSKFQRTSLYLDPVVHKTIKRIALDYNKKPHDLVVEGIEMMLLKYVGKTMEDIKAS